LGEAAAVLGRCRPGANFQGEKRWLVSISSHREMLDFFISFQRLAFANGQPPSMLGPDSVLDTFFTESSLNTQIGTGDNQA
jgi:hypothetical protein